MRKKEGHRTNFNDPNNDLFHKGNIFILGNTHNIYNIYNIHK